MAYPNTPHPLLVKAAQLVEQARAIKAEYPNADVMPADVAEMQDRLLKAASGCRHAYERDQHLDAIGDWLHEPQHKSFGAGDMSPRTLDGDVGGRGMPVLDYELSRRHHKAFMQYIRGGHAAVPAEYKADLVEDATGENLVPPDFAGAVIQELPRLGVLRRLAYVRPTTSNRVDIAPITEGSVGWGKLETGGTLYDATPAPTSDQIVVRDLNGLVKVGRDELEDSDENLESLFRELVSRQFAEAEDDAFAYGNPAAVEPEPEGIARNVGATLASAAGETVVADDLKALKYRVPAEYRRNGVYLAHSSAEEQVALLKDANGQYIWQQSTTEDEPDRLFGKPWYTVDGLPDVLATDDAGAGTDRSVIFGDVRAAYMIADRRRITVQRLDERYAEQGKIGFLFTQRVGGGVIRPVAVAAYLL